MDKKELKLKAEQRLFEAASRYFEEPDCVEKAKLNEKMVQATLPDGRKITVNDEDYTWKFNDADIAGTNVEADEYLGEDDPNSLLPDPAATGEFTGAASRRAANAAKFDKKAGIVANAESDVFNALLPKIEAATKFIIKQKIADGTFKPVGTGHWAIPTNAGKAIQNEIYYKIVHPKWKELGGARNPAATALRRAWEKWTGEYDKPKYTTMQGRVYDLTPEVGGDVKKESTKFNKMLYKAMNEHLTHLYSEKYNVCLTEANKMFIIDDVIVE